MSKAVRIPYTVVQDEDQVWCARAQLSPGVAAYGEGATREEAVADLREGLRGLIAEVGMPTAPRRRLRGRLARRREKRTEAIDVLELEVA